MLYDIKIFFFSVFNSLFSWLFVKSIVILLIGLCFSLLKFIDLLKLNSNIIWFSSIQSNKCEFKLIWMRYHSKHSKNVHTRKENYLPTQGINKKPEKNRPIHLTFDHASATTAVIKRNWEKWCQRQRDEIDWWQDDIPFKVESKGSHANGSNYMPIGHKCKHKCSIIQYDFGKQLHSCCHHLNHQHAHHCLWWDKTFLYPPSLHLFSSSASDSASPLYVRFIVERIGQIPFVFVLDSI